MEKNYKEYRNEVAKDLKTIKKQDPEKAREVLEQEKKKREYIAADLWQKSEGRDLVKQEIKQAEESRKSEIIADACKKFENFMKEQFRKVDYFSKELQRLKTNQDEIGYKYFFSNCEFCKDNLISLKKGYESIYGKDTELGKLVREKVYVDFDAEKISSDFLEKYDNAMLIVSYLEEIERKINDPSFKNTEEYKNDVISRSIKGDTLTIEDINLLNEEQKKVYVLARASKAPYNSDLNSIKIPESLLLEMPNDIQIKYLYAKYYSSHAYNNNFLTQTEFNLLPRSGYHGSQQEYIEHRKWLTEYRGAPELKSETIKVLRSGFSEWKKEGQEKSGELPWYKKIFK